jgi:RNA polymerase sigma-70 factor, ECF subfamily
MCSESDADEALNRRICAGEEPALGELFGRHRERFRRMVQLRLDRRLQGRIDPSDVLQEAFLDASRGLDAYAADPAMSPFLWLRFLNAQRLLTLHRIHLGVLARDAGQVVSLYSGSLPAADS